MFITLSSFIDRWLFCCIKRTALKMEKDRVFAKKIVVRLEDEDKVCTFSSPFHGGSGDNAPVDLARLKQLCLEKFECVETVDRASRVEYSGNISEGGNPEGYMFRKKGDILADDVTVDSLFCIHEDRGEVEEGLVQVEMELVRRKADLQPLAMQVDIRIRSIPERKHDPSGYVYTAYVLLIKLNGVEWEIARRYREFALLDKKLKERCSSVYKERCGQWPKLPFKERMKRHSNGPKTIKIRTNKLWNYIREITNDPVIMRDPPVELLEFLGIVRQEPVKEETIHIHQLKATNVLNPGDIVLFKCCHGGAKLQRNITRSSWDHVGIVVPIDRGGARKEDGISMGILEATREGIEVCPFFQRIISMRDYAVIAVRHLRVDRSAEFLSKLESFVKEVELKRYSLRGLLARVLPFYNPEKNVFCSQLVAQALIKLNCIGPNKKSALFWPVSFSPGGAVDRALARHKVATLSPMKIIDFKISEIYQCRNTS